MSSASFLSLSFDDGVAQRRSYEISGSSVTSCHVEESSLDLPYSTRSLGNGDFGTLVTRYAEHATTYDERQPSSGADHVLTTTVDEDTRSTTASETRRNALGDRRASESKDTSKRTRAIELSCRIRRRRSRIVSHSNPSDQSDIKNHNTPWC